MADSKITIDDIAAALNVSKTTVSRAISGKGRISKETTKRVQDYIKEHNYKPNVYAKGLATQRTYNIAVAWPGDSDPTELPFFQRCLTGMSRTASGAGYDILISVTLGQDISNLKRIVENRKVDGVILTRTLVNDTPAKYLEEAEVPFVAIGSSTDQSVSQIDNDHFGACKEMTATLLKMGLKRLALIGGSDQYVVTEIRKRGFLEAHKEAGIKQDKGLLYANAIDRNQIEAIVEDILRKGADGVICMDDNIAGDVLAVCRDRKIKVPQDLKIASFYDSLVLENNDPSITSLKFDDRGLGAMAVGMLLDKIEGKEVTNKLLKTYEVSLKESTK